jgi:hypothetical protein
LIVMLPADDDGPAGDPGPTRKISYIARCEVSGVIEAFQNKPGEDEETFLARLRERFPNVKYSTLSWPSAEQCPYRGPAELVKETAARLGI